MISSVLVLMKITNLIKNKLLDATRNNEKKKLLMAHQRRVRHCYQKKKLLMAHQRRVRHCYECFYGAPLDGGPLLTFPPL